jgi:hypothetical protein
MSYENGDAEGKMRRREEERSEVQPKADPQCPRADLAPKLVDRDVNAALNHPEGGNLPWFYPRASSVEAVLSETVDAAQTPARLTSQILRPMQRECPYFFRLLGQTGFQART